MSMPLKYRISVAFADKLTAKLITAVGKVLKEKFILDELTSVELSQKVVDIMKKEHNTNVDCENLYYLNGKCVCKKKKPDGYYKLTQNTTVYDLLGNKL